MQQPLLHRRLEQITMRAMHDVDWYDGNACSGKVGLAGQITGPRVPAKQVGKVRRT